MTQLKNTAMKPESLPDLNGADPKRIAAARRHIHNGALWLARMANSFLPPEADGRQLRLAWLDQDRALSTQTFSGNLALRLQLADLHLQFTEDGQPVPHVFDMEDRTPAAAEAWILVELLHRGRERERFSKALPFEIATPMTGDSETYSPDDLTAELGMLTSCFASAAAILREAGGSQDGAPDGGTLWLFPEPLEFGMAVKAAPSKGATPKLFGFSLGDARLREPYFFVAPQKQGSVQNLRPGTTLTASQIHKQSMSPGAVSTFLQNAAVEAARAGA